MQFRSVARANDYRNATLTPSRMAGLGITPMSSGCSLLRISVCSGAGSSWKARHRLASA